MWRKDEPNKPQSSTPESSAHEASSSPGPIPERPAVAPPAAPANEAATGSEGIRIKGEISGRGDLFWDGVLQGKIHITDGSFTVGRNAHINAEIEAREIVIHGEVTGELRGERVQILSTGKLTGGVETRRIVIEDGATLSSKVQVWPEGVPAQTERTSVAPRAKQAAAAAGAQTKEKSGDTVI